MENYSSGLSSLFQAEGEANEMIQLAEQRKQKMQEQSLKETEEELKRL
jgi:hypothetical protein